MKGVIVMTNKIKLKPAAINTLKITAFKWQMSPWEEGFVQDLLLSEYIYRGISEKQYNKFNDIASRNGVDLSGYIHSATDEMQAYEGAINQLKIAVNADKPIRLGKSYDFGDR